MVTLKGSYLSPTELTEPLSFQAESLPSIVGDVNMMQSLLLLLKLPAVPLQRDRECARYVFSMVLCLRLSLPQQWVKVLSDLSPQGIR